tara:strand:- start:121 stop:552 length:432 start_codon:yes stop_codon:yes gene_type:complete
MIIHSDVDKSEPEIDLEKICLVCHDEIVDGLDGLDGLVKLKCSHKYHYKCIFMTYKSMGGNRECPYCRGDGGHLELKKGTVPQMGIHKEYSDYVDGKFNLEDIIYNEGKCKHILKTGKNVGSQCNCNPKPDSNYCGRHIKNYV